MGANNTLTIPAAPVGIHDRSNGNFRLYSKDPDMLYEAAYLFLLSQCGAAFDARHLHRVACNSA